MHLPLQSGADSVLRRMSRRCKIADFSSLVRQARSTINGFNITTDIIVGFPGETEEEWQNTLETVENIGFGHIHIFSYSSREGTKAAGLPNQITADVKKSRSKEMHLLAGKLKNDFYETQLNNQVEVLWESQKADNEGSVRYSGYTPNFCKVETIVANTVLLESRIKMAKLDGFSEDRGVFQGINQ